VNVSDTPRFDYPTGDQDFHWWQPGRRIWSLPQGGSSSPAAFLIQWTGVTNLHIAWSGGVPAVIQYRTPVRRNTRQSLTYTFKDQDKTIIDLTGYVSVTLETKLEGQPYSVLAADFLGSRIGGQVQCGAVFSLVGVWDLQFVAQDGAGNRVPGEPLQALVVPNVEDLALSQLPAY
jgi:hypothetical protein